MLAGYLTWNDYRGPRAPTQIRIEHHKTGEMVLHPLEETTADGHTLFYEEAEAVLAKVPRLGLGIVMRDRPTPSGPRKWDNMSMARLVRALRERLGLPATFTIDACRHGDMTELEEAELTDGPGRSAFVLSSKLGGEDWRCAAQLEQFWQPLLSPSSCGLPTRKWSEPLLRGMLRVSSPMGHNYFAGVGVQQSLI